MFREERSKVMNLDMLSRVSDILQRVGGMEQISRLMVIVYGALCIFGVLNCILGYRILRFWMMIFGFLIGAGAGFGVTYMSGVQDKTMIVGAMAGLGIVLAIVSFLIYRAGIFVLGFGIGISLSIYLVHPTSSFSFFLCILVGVGLGVLAMRYAKGVIIIGTSVLGGVLAGISLAQILGLEQFPYGVLMAVGIAALGMLIQFAINRDRYEEDDEDDEDDEPDRNVKKNRKKDPGISDREEPSDRRRRGDREDRRDSCDRNSADRESRRPRRAADREDRYSERRKNNGGRSSGNNSRNSNSRNNNRNTGSRNSSSDRRNRRSSSDRERSDRGYSSGSGRNQNRSSGGRNGSGKSRYEDPDDYERYDSHDMTGQEEPENTYEDFEKDQQRKRRLDIENMADYYEEKETPVSKNPAHDPKNYDSKDYDPEDYDEWEDEH